MQSLEVPVPMLVVVDHHPYLHLVEIKLLPLDLLMVVISIMSLLHLVH